MTELTLVEVRARTRGKGPQEFKWQGYGKLVPRKVLDKDGEPLKRPDGTEIEVDDLNVEGLVTAEDLPLVLGLFDGNMIKLLEAGIEQVNANLRKKASPVVEVSTEDELTPFIDAMIAEKIMENDPKAVAKWRRGITMSQSMFDWPDRMFAVKQTPQYKALDKLGKVPVVAVV
jgi:hypothetical protein